MTEAGRELDAAVHLAIGYQWDQARCRICGWPLKDPFDDGCRVGNCSQRPAPTRRADEPPAYSADICAAWHVVTKMRARKIAFVLAANGCSEQWSAWFIDGIWALGKQQNEVPEFGDPALLGSATASTAPLAICLAALAATEAL